MPQSELDVARAEAFLIDQCRVAIATEHTAATREAVRHFVTIMRDMAHPPERVLADVKRAAYQAGAGPARAGSLPIRTHTTSSLVDKLVTWVVQDYYGHDAGSVSDAEDELHYGELRLMAELSGELDREPNNHGLRSAR